MIYVGKIVSTHGIKGELKILSDFEYKDKVFVVGKKLVINNQDYVINSYRVHKNFDMVTLNNYNNINDVLFLLKSDVYIRDEDLELDENEILDSELMEYSVVDASGRVGKVLEIFFASPNNKVIRIMFDKEVLIPFNSPMIVSIDKRTKQIKVNLIDGM